MEDLHSELRFNLVEFFKNSPFDEGDELNFEGTLIEGQSYGNFEIISEVGKFLVIKHNESNEIIEFKTEEEKIFAIENLSEIYEENLYSRVYKSVLRDQRDFAHSRFKTFFDEVDSQLAIYENAFDLLLKMKLGEKYEHYLFWKNQEIFKNQESFKELEKNKIFGFQKFNPWYAPIFDNFYYHKNIVTCKTSNIALMIDEFEVSFFNHEVESRYHRAINSLVNEEVEPFLSYLKEKEEANSKIKKAEQDKEIKNTQNSIDETDDLPF